MQHTPIVRLLLITAALAFGAIGVWSLTQPTQGQKPAPFSASAMAKVGAQQVAERSVVVTLIFSHVPAEYQIDLGGGHLLKGTATSQQWTLPGQQALARDGSDWIVRVRWTNGRAQSALRVMCRDAASGQKLVDATLWGQGELEDVVGVY